MVPLLYGKVVLLRRSSLYTHTVVYLDLGVVRVEMPDGAARVLVHNGSRLCNGLLR